MKKQHSRTTCCAIYIKYKQHPSKFLVFASFLFSLLLVLFLSFLFLYCIHEWCLKLIMRAANFCMLYVIHGVTCIVLRLIVSISELMFIDCYHFHNDLKIFLINTSFVNENYELWVLYQFFVIHDFLIYTSKVH